MKMYAQKGPVYDINGDLICVLAKDVDWGETNAADHFAWPKVKDGDPMSPAIAGFVFNFKDWTQEARHG